jgi:3-deoxy-D-manno-octulosonate 8-phosphate phosphatase (KDO 8-P phosphatase)
MALSAGQVDRRMRRVRLVVTDVDGVLTDSITYFSKDGEALKGFNHRDGQGSRILREMGIELAILTGEPSPIVAARAEKLKVKGVMLGVDDKLPALEAFARGRGVALSEIAYLGDDLNDLEVLGAVGLAVVPADGCAEAKALAHWVTRATGGRGVLREFIDRFRRVRGFKLSKG